MVELPAGKTFNDLSDNLKKTVRDLDPDLVWIYDVFQEEIQKTGDRSESTRQARNETGLLALSFDPGAEKRAIRNVVAQFVPSLIDRTLRRTKGVPGARVQEAMLDTDLTDFPDRGNNDQASRTADLDGCRNPDHLCPGTGIDAPGAWKVSTAANGGQFGGNGGGPGLIDLEYAWSIGLDVFRDLSLPLLTGCPPRNYQGHGTAVLGLVAARCHKGGATTYCGVAPELPWLGRASVRQEVELLNGGALGVPAVRNDFSPGTAIFRLREHFGKSGVLPGTILLVEVTTREGFPIEYLDEVRGQLLDLQQKGLVVVQPAGNGSKKITELPDRSSETLLVGAVVRRSSKWERHSDSNSGPRIDCFAPGGSITGIYNLPALNATSAAGALVAGMAAGIQSARLAAGKQPFCPQEMRELFSNASGNGSFTPPSFASLVKEALK